jgi:hypothetical protein
VEKKNNWEFVFDVIKGAILLVLYMSLVSYLCFRAFDGFEYLIVLGALVYFAFRKVSSLKFLNSLNFKEIIKKFR